MARIWCSCDSCTIAPFRSWRFRFCGYFMIMISFAFHRLIVVERIEVEIRH